MSGFFQEVYQVVAQIPEGQVATYGQIAAILGHPRGARIVGWAMRGVPGGLKIPCHRVVNKTGALAPDYVFGGAVIQRTLLSMEGVTFLEDGRIDLSRHLWRIDTKISSSGKNTFISKRKNNKKAKS